MVVAIHSPLGRGVDSKHASRCSEPHLLNYSGHTLSTRFLLACLPKSLYEGLRSSSGVRADVFQNLITVLTADLCELYWQGVPGGHGEQCFLIPLKCMGDWPFIVKAGCLGRSFMNVSKSGSSKAVPKGICHRCRADQPGYPWEDFASDTPAWISSYNTVPPFTSRPPLLDLPHDPTDEPSFFAYDLFHAWNLGAGKVFLGSALVVVADAHEGRNINEKFEQIEKSFFKYCKDSHLHPYIRKLTREVAGDSNYPTATWSKGSTTTCVLRWLVWWGKQNSHVVDNDQLLKVVIDAATLKEGFLHGVYREGVFISKRQGLFLTHQGLQFLRRYGEAARLSYDCEQALFLLQPNLHRLHHLYTDMGWQCHTAGRCINPLTFATQPEEDFIGRPSRTSRRVTAKPFKLIERTLQRHLMASRAKFIEAGLLIEGRT